MTRISGHTPGGPTPGLMPRGSAAPRRLARGPAPLLAGLLIACAALAPAASAQTISGATYTADPLTDAQRQEVIAFVTAHAARLSGDDPQAIEASRGDVTNVYGVHSSQEGSQAFIDFYNEQLALAYVNVLTNGTPQGRLNVGLMLGRLDVPQVTGLFQQALGDDNVAVRYAAAKAINDLIAFDGRQNLNQQLGADTWNDVLDTVVAALAVEPSPLVTGQLSLALGTIPVPAAQDQAIGVLDNRLPLIQGQPAQVLRNELDLLRRTIVVVNGRAQAQRAQQLRRAMAVAMKYANVIQGQLAAGNLTPTIVEDKTNFLRYLEASVLRDAAMGTFNFRETELPDPQTINNALRTQDWDALAEGIAAYVPVLTDRRIGLDPVALQVP